jgi:hypothetical protein
MQSTILCVTEAMDRAIPRSNGTCLVALSELGSICSMWCKCSQHGRRKNLEGLQYQSARIWRVLVNERSYTFWSSRRRDADLLREIDRERQTVSSRRPHLRRASGPEASREEVRAQARVGGGSLLFLFLFEPGSLLFEAEDAMGRGRSEPRRIQSGKLRYWQLDRR